MMTLTAEQMEVIDAGNPVHMHAIGGPVDVFVDGVKQSMVARCSIKDGWAEVFITDDKGRVKVFDSEPRVRYRWVYGKVEIRPIKD